MRRYLLPVLAVLGLLTAVVVVILQNRPVVPQRPAAPSPKVPFASFVAGSGVVEAAGGNIAVGTPVPGIVTAVFVSFGERVARGAPLFKIDDRDLQSQLVPAQARVREAETRLAQARGREEIGESVRDKRAISLDELRDRRSAVAVASAALETARAEVTRVELEIGRRTVRALVPGQVLQLGVRPGEFAPSGATPAPLVLLGRERRLWLRVDVDQYDAWRVRTKAAAVAYLRGNPERGTKLRFERIEPSLVPKSSLTGSSTERVDTRVLQVIYSFDPSDLPGSYVGQQMDVYIEAPPVAATAGTPHPKGTP